MVLPKLNDKPKYTMKVPSTGKRVRYRPYLVKEEKVLMMAAETQDMKQAMMALADTIEACCEGPYDKNALTTFDIEYMFTKIRAKSSGETSKVMLPCEKCEAPNEVTIDLEGLELKTKKKEENIQLQDDIYVELQYPAFTTVIDYDFENMSQTEAGFEMASKCIRAVLTEEERIDCNDVPKEEVISFVESMTADQFQSLVNFLSEMPKLETDVKFACEDCGEENDIHIEGMQNFF